MFPYGAPGIALAALRTCVALQLLDRALSVASLSLWTVCAAVIVTLTLIIGLATPFFALLSVPVAWLATAGPIGTWGESLVFENVYAIALLFLGPGAYSLDAKIYGRRLIQTPTTGADSENGRRSGPLT
jgi:hypothetical protein